MNAAAAVDMLDRSDAVNVCADELKLEVELDESREIQQGWQERRPCTHAKGSRHIVSPIAA